jgi:hypothetical protein
VAQFEFVDVLKGVGVGRAQSNPILVQSDLTDPFDRKSAPSDRI